MRQFNTSLHYCNNIQQCSATDAQKKIAKRFEIQQATIQTGLKNLIAAHPSTSASEKKKEEDAMDDLASELENMPPSAPPNYVEKCIETTSNFVHGLSTMGKSINKHHMMSGMVLSFCKDVVMCNIPNTTVGAVEESCKRASDVFLNVDVSTKDEADDRTVHDFCAIAGAVERGGAEAERYECPQNVLRREEDERLRQGIKLSRAGDHPSSGMRGEDVVEADWKLTRQKMGKVGKAEREEWSEYVKGTDLD